MTRHTFTRNELAIEDPLIRATTFYRRQYRALLSAAVFHAGEVARNAHNALTACIVARDAMFDDPGPPLAKTAGAVRIAQSALAECEDARISIAALHAQVQGELAALLAAARAGKQQRRVGSRHEAKRRAATRE